MDYIELTLAIAKQIRLEGYSDHATAIEDAVNYSSTGTEILVKVHQALKRIPEGISASTRTGVTQLLRQIEGLATGISFAD